jgi:outer membrane protein TolC
VLLEADRRIEQQQSSVELARIADKPDLVLSGGWMYRGGLPSIWEINIGVGLPIRKSERQEPATDEAIDELRALQQDRAAAGLEVQARVRDAWLRMDRARQLIEMYRDVILPQAALSLESTMSSYRVGQVDFLSVLDAIGKLLTFRTELERESADYYVAAAELEMQLGRSLGATPERVWTSPAVSPDTRTGGGAPRDGGSR